MTKTNKASSILLSGVPEVNSASGGFTRKKYFNDINKVKDSIKSIVNLVSQVSNYITPEIKKTNDRELCRCLDVLISEGTEISSELNQLENSINSLGNIKDDEEFMMNSFAVMQDAERILNRTNGNYTTEHNNAMNRINFLKAQGNKQ